MKNHSYSLYDKLMYHSMYRRGYDVHGTIAEKNELFEENYKHCNILFSFKWHALLWVL